MKSLSYVLAILMITTQLLSTAWAETDISQWKRVSFKEAMAGQLRPLDLELSLPPEYSIRYSNRANIGIFWGHEEDIRSVMQSNPPNLTHIEHGVFQIFWSMRVGYFIKDDKFSGEDEAEKRMKDMGVTLTRNERKAIGGHPVWIQTGKYKGKDIFSFYIATLSGTNVYTILYHVPVKPAGDEASVWEAVIASIDSPAYKNDSPDGRDAGTTIEKLLDALKPVGNTQTTIIASHTLGPVSASERPTIRQTATLVEDQTGFKSINFDRSSSRRLVEGNNTTLYGDPWIYPHRNGQVQTNDGRIVFNVLENGKRLPVPEISVEDFQQRSRSAFTVLSGAEMMLIDPLHAIVAEVINLFDFKENRTPSEIVLNGRPNRNRLQKLLDDVGMPRLNKGRNIVDEMMQRWAKATIIIDPDSFEVSDLTVEGINQMQPFQIKITFKRQHLK